MSFTFEPSRYPTTPGCYLMRNAAGRVIYVGKAKNLRRRLASYFRPVRKRKTRRDYRIDKLVAAVAAIDIILVNTELESLVLENNLIKHYHPRFNRMLMAEDSGYYYIVLTEEPLPRLVPYRKHRINKALAGEDVERRFGPYLTRESRDGLLEYVTDHFGLRTCSPLPSRVCLRYHLNACSGICAGHVTPEAYAANVQAAMTFLARPSTAMAGDMRAEIDVCAAQLAFERAQRIKKQVLALEATLQPQIVERDIDCDQDVIYFGPAKAHCALVATIRHGILLGVALHPLDAAGDYAQMCRAFLLARYIHSGPDEVICNAPGEAAVALRAVSRGMRVLCPIAGDEYALLELCRLNYEYQINVKREA
ncbi:MAG: GIY-YIG nuclease family protein [Anaerolineae bacterium]|nr:GIY-YIG nuclease family protein [Anaerolineae bacterium]